MTKPNKIYKILGKEGRITIPEIIRENCGFADNDIISFEEKDDCVILRRESPSEPPSLVVNITVNYVEV